MDIIPCLVKGTKMPSKPKLKYQTEIYSYSCLQSHPACTSSISVIHSVLAAICSDPGSAGWSPSKAQKQPGVFPKEYLATTTTTSSLPRKTFSCPSSTESQCKPCAPHPYAVCFRPHSDWGFSSLLSEDECFYSVCSQASIKSSQYMG